MGWPNDKLFVHKKTGKIYAVLGNAINATNSEDGQKMVVYRNAAGALFAREVAEFYCKFREVNKDEEEVSWKKFLKIS